MSTTPVSTPGISKADLWLSIIKIALGTIGSVVPGGAAATSLIGALVSIVISAKSGYEAEVGQPLDLAKIPIETLVQ